MKDEESPVKEESGGNFNDMEDFLMGHNNGGGAEPVVNVMPTHDPTYGHRLTLKKSTFGDHTNHLITDEMNKRAAHAENHGQQAHGHLHNFLHLQQTFVNVQNAHLNGMVGPLTTSVPLDLDFLYN
jgi:hypothetical protein